MQIICSQLHSVRQSQVAEGEEPVGQVEGRVLGKVTCLQYLIRKIVII